MAIESAPPPVMPSDIDLSPAGLAGELFSSLDGWAAVLGPGYLTYEDADTPPPPGGIIIPSIVGIQETVETGRLENGLAISVAFPEQPKKSWWEADHIQVIDLGPVPDSVFKLHTAGNAPAKPDRYIAVHVSNLSIASCNEGFLGMPPGTYGSCVESMKSHRILLESSNLDIHSVPVFDLGNFMILEIDDQNNVHFLNEPYTYPSALKLSDLVKSVSGNLYPTVDSYALAVDDGLLNQFPVINPETLKPIPTPTQVTVGSTLPTALPTSESPPTTVYVAPPSTEAIQPFMSEAEKSVAAVSYEFAAGSLSGMTAYESRSDNPAALNLIALLSTYPSQDEVAKVFNDGNFWNWINPKWWRGDPSVFCEIDRSLGFTAKKILYRSLYPETNSFVMVADNDGMTFYMTGSMESLQKGVRNGAITVHATDKDGQKLTVGVENLRRDILGAHVGGLLSERDERKVRLVSPRMVRQMQAQLQRDVDVESVPISSLLSGTITGFIQVKEMNGSFGYESVTFPAGAMATTNVHNTVVYDELSGKYYKTLSIDTSDTINQMWVKRYNEMHPLMDSADGSIKGSGFPALTKITGETIHILVPLDGYVEMPSNLSAPVPTPTPMPTEIPTPPVSAIDPFAAARKIDLLAMATYHPRVLWSREISSGRRIPKKSAWDSSTVLYLSPEQRVQQYKAQKQQRIIA